MIKRIDLRIRDPYIVAKDGKYYLYKSLNLEKPERVVVHVSEDLENWSEEKTVYTFPEDSWKDAEIWAPEVHEYLGKFYIFLSIKGKNGLRGTEISVSDTPDGIFTPIANRPATPLDKSCIDGTLFVDGDTPYIIYSRDWPNNFIKEKGVYVGQIWGQELSKDLTTPVGEPFLMFESNECPYSLERPATGIWEDKPMVRYGSDAPFINRLSNGKLFLTWSPYPNNNYVILGAVADGIKGKWKHIDKPLYDNNGGHAMFFTTFDGKRKVCMHQPEAWMKERALILDVIEKDGELVIVNREERNDK